jgi:hypothetical protein
MSKKILDKDQPEGFMNPREGGVYVRRADPLYWFKVWKLDDKRVTTHGSEGGGTTNTSVEWFLDDLDRNGTDYTYFPAGTPEAKEAVRTPANRLRDLLRSLNRLV